MSKINWGGIGQKDYELGVDHGVLYPLEDDGYLNGVAWNGLTNVTETPEGAEATDLYADNILYGTLLSAEKLTMSIEHYSTPIEFYSCDGILIENGVYITGQPRAPFGFVFRTKMGNDVNPELGYKLHLVYGCKAGVAERAYGTVNDSPEVITFSRTVTTTPVTTSDGKVTAELIIDSTKAPAAGLALLEAALYGTENSEPYLPTPDEVRLMMSGSVTAKINPASATVAVGGEKQFTCNVPVVWSVSESDSFISSTGLLIVSPEETLETLTVTATPKNNTIAPVTAIVTVG